MGQKTLSISRISELTGKDRRTVSKRLSGLMPISGHKGAKLYDSEQALKLVFLPDIENELKTKITVEQAPDHAGGYDGTVDENRIKRAKAEKLELELSEKRGELVAVEDIVKEVRKEYNFVRTNLLSIPSKAARSLSIVDDPALIQEKLDFYINDVLKALTMGDPDEQ